MTNNTPNWASFWKNNPVGFDAIMQESATFVREKLLAHQLLKPSDVLLDMGCGPGLLVAELQNEVQTIIGADISTAYIDICTQKFEQNKNLSFVPFASFDYTEIEKIIANQNVNKVIILSVLQYYQNETQVKDLIIALKNAAAQRTTKEPFSCIIADLIPKNHSFFADIRDLVFLALRKGFVLALFKFILYTLYSDYRKFKKVGLLNLDYVFFEQFAAEQGLKISKTPQITMHADRYSVLLAF